MRLRKKKFGYDQTALCDALAGTQPAANYQYYDTALRHAEDLVTGHRHTAIPAGGRDDNIVGLGEADGGKGAQD